MGLLCTQPSVLSLPTFGRSLAAVLMQQETVNISEIKLSSHFVDCWKGKCSFIHLRICTTDGDSK